jgi:hypothetical protein
MQVIETAETLVRREGHHAGSEAEFRERLLPVEAGSLADRLRQKLLEFMKDLDRLFSLNVNKPSPAPNAE